jgi:branched-chain amino acid transport system substrate-binding protein
MDGGNEMTRPRIKDKGSRIRVKGQINRHRLILNPLMLNPLLLMLAFVPGCGEHGRESVSNGPVRIALVAPLSGPLEHEAQMLRRGALTALSEAQSRAGDLEVELLVKDSPCDAREAAVIAGRVAADASVCAVIGYLCASSVLAALPVYQGANLPVINPVVSAEYVRNEDASHLFPLLYGDAAQGAFLAAYVKRGLKLERVAIVSDASAYGRMLAASFTAEAGRQRLDMAVRASISADAAGAARAVQELRGAHAEAIFLACCPETAWAFLQEQHDGHPDWVVLSPDRMADLEFYETTGEAAEGLLVCQPLLLETDSQEVCRFVERFQCLHKRQPDWIAAGGYDAMRLVLEVLGRSGSERGAVLESLRAIKSPETAFCGLSGPVFFTRDGGSRRPLYVGRLHRGFLHPADPASVDFRGLSGDGKGAR